MSSTFSPIIELGNGPLERFSVLQKFLLVATGTVILTISAKIQVPFWPVPMTMQSCVVLILGMALGGRLAGYTVLLYLMEGLAGLPVFAGTPEKGMGIAYIVGPTGGYLLGFLAAAVVTGRLAEMGWDRKIPSAFAAAFIGMVIIYGFGLAWLSSFVGVEKSWTLGAAPFVLGDGFKILLATATLPVAWKIKSIIQDK